MIIYSIVISFYSFAHANLRKIEKNIYQFPCDMGESHTWLREKVRVSRIKNEVRWLKYNVHDISYASIIKASIEFHPLMVQSFSSDH